MQLLIEWVDRIIEERNKSNKIKCNTYVKCKYKRNVASERSAGSQNGRTKEFH